MIAIPWWGGLLGGLLGLFQANKQAQAQQQAIEAARAAAQLSPEEEADIRRKAQANIGTALSRRGLMDSGLLASGIAGIEPEIARIRGERARGGAGLLSGIYASQANQPNFLSSFIPFALQYGVKSPSGDWWVKPATVTQ